MIEILTGRGFDKAVSDLGLAATRTYERNIKSPFDEPYEVWEILNDDFDLLCSIPEENWHEDWGWWRHSTGSIMHTPNQVYEINGFRIIAWDGIDRDSFKLNYCKNCEDRLSGDCKAEKADIAFCCGERKYDNLFVYFECELGLTAYRNTCALAMDLAKYNNMKLSDLLHWTVG